MTDPLITQAKAIIEKASWANPEHYIDACIPTTITALLTALIERTEALEKVSKLKNYTLLGDPTNYDFDAEKAYSAGATHAFIEAAMMADEALQGGDRD